MDVIINNATPAQVQVAPALPQFVPQQAVPYGPSGYGFRPDNDNDGPGFGLFLLLGVGAVLLFRRRRRWGPRHASAGGAAGETKEFWQRGRARFFSDRALDIARERYARGEINADDYAALRRTLGGEDMGGTEKPNAGT
ncbi:hypothetical protein V3W47_04195 [Deinococcus sp. YIM 134068]|uniref:hypothetical protein n=1 Tax=Deinococcus lichenicola TaxID=3118910 RepID=UPI002F94F1F4